MELFTIGFTRKSAERFFDLLRTSRVELLVDTRLNPDGQLSGFARRVDLPFLLDRLAGCAYVHRPDFAPTKDILSEYRNDGDWDRYVHRYADLLDERFVPAPEDRSLFSDRRSCLLCSEHTPDRCHRRLLAERLSRAWPDMEIVHLR